MATVSQLYPSVDGENWAKAPALLVTLRSPWNGSLRAQIHCAGIEGVNAAVASAQAAAFGWRRYTAADRAQWIEAAAEQVEKRLPLIVDAMIGDIGKPRRAATYEVQRTVAFMRATARQLLTLGTENLPLDVNPGGQGRIGIVQRIPYGIVAAVTPFNAPANLLMQKVAPALAMGNAVIVKPSLEGTRVALIIGECFAAAGLPAGFLSVLPGGGEEACALAAHPAVSLVTLTGGPAAAEALAKAAGAKKFVAELGGNAANIVLDDADIEDAAKRIAISGFEACGQQCISAQRIIVSRSIYAPMLDLLVKAAEDMNLGDPAEQTTDLGPVVHERAADRIMNSLNLSVQAGARILTGGTRSGCMIAPTIVIDAPSESPIVKDEIFGPAIVVIPVESDEEAIGVANDNDAGLQGAVFSSGINRALYVAGALNVGSVWINEGSRFRLDSYPFGGVGKSGHGREGVRYALEEYSQMKFTGIRLS